MGTPASPPRRVVPPVLTDPPTLPPSSSAPLVGRRKRRIPRAAMIALTIAILAAVGVVVAHFLKTASQREKVERFHNQLQLAAQESIRQDSWKGPHDVGDTRYLLISFADQHPAIQELAKNFKTPLSALTFYINNSRTDAAHTIDASGATLHFADGTTHSAPDQLSVLQSASADRDALLEAFPVPIPVAPREQSFGRVIFIPADTDLRALTAVTVKIDGAPSKIEGSYRTQAQEQELQKARIMKGLEHDSAKTQEEERERVKYLN